MKTVRSFSRSEATLNEQARSVNLQRLISHSVKLFNSLSSSKGFNQFFINTINSKTVGFPLITETG